MEKETFMLLLIPRRLKLLPYYSCTDAQIFTSKQGILSTNFANEILRCVYANCCAENFVYKNRLKMGQHFNSIT